MAVIDDKTPDRDLDAMARGGIRAIRINLKLRRRPIPPSRGNVFKQAVKRVQDAIGTSKCTPRRR